MLDIPPVSLENSEFLRFPLPGQLVRGAAEMGLLKLTPIQERVIPAALGGKTLIVRSGVGTGRTVAYLLPALARVKKPKGVQVLVLAATRTLATQIAADARRLGAHLPIVSVACLDGARKGGAEDDDLANGPTFVVGLPERIGDHVDRGSLPLEGVEVVVLDLADRMGAKGLAAADQVLVRAPHRRQAMVFAESMPDELERVLARRLPNADELSADHVGPPQQVFLNASNGDRLGILEALLAREKADRCVVVVRDRNAAEPVAERLAKFGLGARAFHSGVPPTKRSRMWKDFQTGTFTTLVATDSATGEISVDRVRLVVNYDVPEAADEYDRRLGWLKPVGKAGTLVTLVPPEQAGLLPALEPAAGTIKVVEPPAGAKKAAPAKAVPKAPRNESKDADRESWRPSWTGPKRR